MVWASPIPLSEDAVCVGRQEEMVAWLFHFAKPLHRHGRPPVSTLHLDTV